MTVPTDPYTERDASQREYNYIQSEIRLVRKCSLKVKKNLNITYLIYNYNTNFFTDEIVSEIEWLVRKW